MTRISFEQLFRCDLCNRTVDTATRDRARHVWQPLIICERCVRESDPKARALSSVAAAATL